MTGADHLVGAPGNPEIVNRGRAHLFYAAGVLDAAAPFTRSAIDADLPLAAFNAQNAISLPALQAACGLAAQRRVDAQQAYHDRVVELDQQCRDGLSGLQP